MSEVIGTPTILLVSGSTQTTRSISRLLSEHFKIVHAPDAANAWNMLQQQSSISLMICALRRAIDHHALLERIRQARDSLLAGLPVMLLVSENDTEEQREQAFAAGATDFIDMPFSGIELKTRARLHAKLYKVYNYDHTQEIKIQDTNVDLLNTLMQQEVFVSRLRQELAFCSRHKSYVSTCLLKICNEDDIEDKYGKKILNPLFRALAGQIEKQIRREDSFAYLGKATFALMFPVTNGLGANVVIKRLMHGIAEMHLKHEGRYIELNTCAALYSLIPDESSKSDDVMQTLEDRLLTAEQKGTGEIVSSRSELENTVISVEQAINKVRYGQTEGLEKSVPELLAKLKPLLQYAREHDELAVQELFDDISD